MSKNKKRLKERQHERQMKQQRSGEAQQKRREAKPQKNSRQFPKKKPFLAISLIVVIFVVILVWQFNIKNFTTICISADGTIDPAVAANLLELAENALALL